MPLPVCVILGPTASGKSALAQAVARACGGEILSADSMSVYRGMDIGTSKPTPAERAEIVHHGLDLVEPDQAFTVARWLEVAEPLVRSAAASGRPLVIVGGTPLYYQALFQGLFEGPPADAVFRAELAGLAALELHGKLARVDPQAAMRIHANDRKRLTRALEVFWATGRRITEHQTQWDAQQRYPSLRVGLSWPRQELDRRINARTRQMLEAGWQQEVRQLLERYGEFSATAAEAAGYRLLADVVRGSARLEDAAEQIKIRTRQLAKRQMTWFRRFQNVRWLPGEAPPAENARAVLALWKDGQ